MKKIVTILSVTLFAVGFGIAYGGEVSSVRAYDTFQIERPAVNQAVESSAAGSQRQIDTNQVEGPAGSSVRAFDTFDILKPAGSSRAAEGSAPGSLRHNFAGKESSVRAYDTFEIQR